MIIIPSLDLFNACLTSAINRLNVDAKQIFFNNNNRFVVTKSYLDELESLVLDKEIFSSLTVELIDNDQILSPTIQHDENNSYFIDIILKYHASNCFPVSLENCYDDKIPNLIVLNKSKKFNSHWIIRELICRGLFSLKYYHFKSDQSIENFFQLLLKLFAQNEAVYIFNRYTETKILLTLKGKRIYYFSYLKQPNRNKHEFISNRNELRAKLGGKLVLKVTGSSKLIHERKLFAGQINITSDNSFDNLSIDDPNWKIDVEHDPNCLLEWKRKIDKFSSYD